MGAKMSCVLEVAHRCADCLLQVTAEHPEFDGRIRVGDYKQIVKLECVQARDPVAPHAPATFPLLLLHFFGCSCTTGVLLLHCYHTAPAHSVDPHAAAVVLLHCCCSPRVLLMMHVVALLLLPSQF